MYVVLRVNHFDNYKRAETNVSVEQIFSDKESAYRFAVIETVYFESDERENWSESFAEWRESVKDCKTWEEMYDSDNLIESFIGGPTYTMYPTGTWFVVDEATHYLSRGVVDPPDMDKDLPILELSE